NHHRIGEKKVRGAHRRIFEYERHPRQDKVQIPASSILSRGTPRRISKRQHPSHPSRHGKLRGSSSPRRSGQLC
ncbi:hypothetical protein A2U01_0100392, partial [Trifolium medium]|nr:hypothetical protein [Trifolium medium]